MKLGLDTKGVARRIERIPSIYKTIIVLVIAVLLLVALIYLFAKPQWEESEKLQKEQAQLQQELNNLREIKNNLEKHKREYQQMLAQLDDVLKQLPESKDIPNLLRSVTSVGEETRLKIKYFEPKAIKQKEFYSELPFDIKFNGPFHSVATFFDDVRRMERLVNITSFSLESKGVGKNAILEGTCSANAYVYQKERPAAQKKGGKEGVK